MRQSKSEHRAALRTNWPSAALKSAANAHVGHTRTNSEQIIVPSAYTDGYRQSERAKHVHNLMLHGYSYADAVELVKALGM